VTVDATSSISIGQVQAKKRATARISYFRADNRSRTGSNWVVRSGSRVVRPRGAKRLVPKTASHFASIRACLHQQKLRLYKAMQGFATFVLF
jgi:hypothetical protein